MTKHTELKAVNQGTAPAAGTLALPPLGGHVGRIRHSPVRILSAQPHSPVILACRETLQKSPDIPCVSSHRLGLWRLLIPIFGSKSASFAAKSQFEIFQFPFLQRQRTQRLICSTLRWGNRPAARGELAESAAALQADDETRSAGAASSI